MPHGMIPTRQELSAALSRFRTRVESHIHEALTSLDERATKERRYISDLESQKQMKTGELVDGEMLEGLGLGAAHRVGVRTRARDNIPCLFMPCPERGRVRRRAWELEVAVLGGFGPEWGLRCFTGLLVQLLNCYSEAQRAGLGARSVH
ncbi:uncharacterized protein PgNI_08676 [Pyricularia grisea]|uniref:Uncharacterized protein n=1 Tax=Pyricularia grisea TaxID=148305 RepID=A0A6P8AWZ0_PYRGI|nr:uncharacterized protein PgNI_08676 [Pyricularia grisea]TLD06725.1 hypothetical protein PgNI_08676 [Pyricularia grisea]